jgi:adenosylcobinamide kinase/adenosylcobinamide-phosphate guanylyltransferase
MMVLVTGGSGSGKSAFAERVACALAAWEEQRAAGGVRPATARAVRMDAESCCIEAAGAAASVNVGAGALENAPAGGDPTDRRFVGRLVYLATMDDIVNPDGTRPAAARIARHRAQRAGRGFATVECPRGLGDLEFSGDETVLLEDVGNALANELFAPDAPFAPRRAEAQVADGIAHVAQMCRNLVVVTNEVGADVLPAAIETRAYVRALGRLSCRMAARADVVCEVVAGRANVLTGAPALAAVLAGAWGGAGRGSAAEGAHADGVCAATAENAADTQAADDAQAAGGGAAHAGADGTEASR